MSRARTRSVPRLPDQLTDAERTKPSVPAVVLSLLVLWRHIYAPFLLYDIIVLYVGHSDKAPLLRRIRHLGSACYLNIAVFHADTSWVVQVGKFGLFRLSRATLGLLLLPFSQAHSGAAAVLVDELDVESLDTTACRRPGAFVRASRVSKRFSNPCHHQVAWVAPF